MVTLSDLEGMFENMRAQTTWNVNGLLLWGYFFTDPSAESLERAAQYLAERGFRCVRIYRADNSHLHVLHVERIERHTPKTLYARNSEFEKLACELGLESYDGMDVGVAPA